MSRDKDNELESDAVDTPSEVNCEDCGKKIPKARLEAVPTTTRCVKCAAEEESKHKVQEVLLDDYDPAEFVDMLYSDE